MTSIYGVKKVSDTVRISISSTANKKAYDCMKLLGNINSRQELLEIAIDRLYVNLIDENYDEDKDTFISLLHAMDDKLELLIERVE